MSSSLEQHRDIIGRLQFFAHKPNLSARLKKALGPHWSAPLEFQLKMELQRRDKPCSRAFRINDVNSKITPEYHQYGDLEHGLEAHTKVEFERLFEGYGGRYTVGLNEELRKFAENNMAVIMHDQNNHDTHIYALDISERTYRKEERMHLGVRATLHPQAIPVTEKCEPNDFLYSTTPPEAVTQDISLNGLKLRCESELNNGQHVLVRFEGLEKEFVFKQPYVAYQVVNRISKGQEGMVYALQKVKNKHHREFDQFITNLIKANRGIYKVDVASVESSVKRNVTEQFITNRDAGFAAFKSGSCWSHAYASQLGAGTYEQIGPQRSNPLHSLIEKDKLWLNTEGGSVYWAVLKKKNGTLFSTMLSESPLSIAFFNYAARHTDALFFKVSRGPIHKERAFLGNSLPQTAPKTREATLQRKLVDHYSEKTRELIVSFTGMLRFTPIEPGIIKQLTPKGAIDKETIRKCNRFALTKQTKPPLNFVQARARELRREDRFLFERRGTLNTTEHTIKTQCINISASGMALLVAPDAAPPVGTVVTVRLDDMPTIDMNPAQFRYKIVKVEQGQLSLQSFGGGPGRNYWLTYIDRHFNDLEPIQPHNKGGRDLLGLDRAMRNIYNAAIQNHRCLIRFNRAQVVPSHINIGPENQGGLWSAERASDAQHLESKRVLCDINVQKWMSTSIRNISSERPFEHRLLRVVYDPKKQGGGRIRTLNFLDENQHLMDQKATQQALAKKGLRCTFYMISLTRKSKVFDRYFREELNYIEKLKPHLSETLNEMVARTSGVVSLTHLELPEAGKGE